jgi:hypothetical protein
MMVREVIAAVILPRGKVEARGMRIMRFEVSVSYDATYIPTTGTVFRKPAVT